MAGTQEIASARGNSHSLSSDKFLTVAANLLHKGFFDSTRTAAKGIYRDLMEGRPVKLTRLKMEDDSLLEIGLSMDHSEYRGRLSFGAFRGAIGVLIANIAEAVKEPDRIRTFTEEQNPNSMLFGVTAVTAEGGEPSVLALAAETLPEDAAVMLKLLYLDPAQFAQPDVTTTA
jgi:hypothetical protein